MTIPTVRSVNQEGETIPQTKHQGADSRRSTRAGRGQATRAQIVEAACALIGEFGYEGVTASALIERAGISKGGLYHHFEHLDDVILAAYQKTAADFFKDLGTPEPDNLDDYLAHVEHVMFDRLFVDPQAMRIMHELLPKAMFDPFFGERRQLLLDSGLDIMSNSFADSFKEKVKPGELKIVLNAVGVFMTGLAVQAETSGDLAQCRKLWRWFRAQLSASFDGTRERF